MEALTREEKQQLFLENIQSKVNTLQNFYDDDSPEWQTINKIQELLEELEE